MIKERYFILCHPTFAGPKVHLSQEIVNFMQVDTGHVITKVVDIVNEADTEAVFQVRNVV